MTVMTYAGSYAIGALLILGVLAIWEESTDLRDAFWWSIFWPYTLFLMLLLAAFWVVDRLKRFRT